MPPPIFCAIPDTQTLPVTSFAANEYEALPSNAGDAPPRCADAYDTVVVIAC